MAAAAPILANAVPAPRLHPGRVGAVCLLLLAASGLTFVVAGAFVILGMFRVVPGYVVITPALAGLALAVILSMTSCWFASSQEDDAEAADEDESDGDNDDGGGGLRPEEDPPRDPGPTDGIEWDAFDRERQAWEAERSADRDAGRELVGV